TAGPSMSCEVSSEATMKTCTYIRRSPPGRRLALAGQVRRACSAVRSVRQAWTRRADLDHKGSASFSARAPGGPQQPPVYDLRPRPPRPGRRRSSLRSDRQRPSQPMKILTWPAACSALSDACWRSTTTSNLDDRPRGAHQKVDGARPSDHQDGGRERAAALAGEQLSYSDPLDVGSCDPYNTGAFRVLAQRPRRRTLDDMRQLDAEIRRSRKPWR